MAQPGIDATSAMNAAANQAVSGSLNNAASAGAQNANNVDANTTISSIGDLKAKAPAIYNAFLQFFAVQMCNEQVHQNQQFSQTLREEREEEGASG
jgi:hypothetical protein